MHILLLGSDWSTACAIASKLRGAGHLVTIAHVSSDPRSITAEHCDGGLFDLLVFDSSGIDLAQELIKAGIAGSALAYTGEFELALLDYSEHAIQIARSLANARVWTSRES